MSSEKVYDEIDICPQAHEILNNQKPALRENKVLGAYGGIEQYLDIQFRLLREDFVRPLRELISEYIRTKNDRKAAKKLRNVYRNVRILDAKAKGENVIGSCECDYTPIKSIDEEVNITKQFYKTE